VLSLSTSYLAKILFLFVSVLMVYSYAGCHFFGSITKGSKMDDYVNFTTFPKALLTLFKCATRSQWRFLMIDCSVLNQYCKFIKLIKISLETMKINVECHSLLWGPTTTVFMSFQIWSSGTCLSALQWNNSQVIERKIIFKFSSRNKIRFFKHI
jgi:hypothetical protein